MKAWPILLLLAPAVVSAAGPAWQGGTLRACEAEDGYPPFTFRAADGHAAGFSIDLLKAALAGTGTRVDVAFIPNKRCTAEMDSGEMDIDLDSSWDASVVGRWLASDSIWEATYVLYYDKSRFPAGLTAAQVKAEPERYRGCGLTGDVYNGFAPGQVDDRSHQSKDLFSRLFAGGCAFVPDYIEFGAAYRLRGRPLLAEPRLGWSRYPMPDRPELPRAYEPGDREPIFYYVRGSLPGVADLLARINAVDAAWRRDGRLRQAMSRYIDLAVVDAVN